jgi:uncharacterized protein YjbI with pentapeptide repeats
MKEDQPSNSELISRIRLVSDFVRQQTEHDSVRINDMRDKPLMPSYFLRIAETWCISFVGQSIEERDWSNRRMLGARFDGSCMKQCDFHNSRLVGSTFQSAKLEGVNFDNAIMDGVTLSKGV